MEHYKNLQIEDIEGEYWIDAFGYDGLYEVSNYGRIKSLQKEVLSKGGSTQIRPPKILKQSLSYKKGKLQGVIISLSNEMGRVSKNVSKLIYMSFYHNESFSENECVMHYDKNILNNNLLNLKKTTRSISKKIDLEKSKPTILAIPINLKKAQKLRADFFEKRISKKCNICNLEKELSCFIHGHNQCKKCYNILKQQERKSFIEDRTELKCRDCGNVKPIVEFPKHNKSKCKKCTNNDARKNRLKNKNT
ncbi:MAG: NUMOD4 domain-containing protein [Myroides sp.]